jgi:hypothetical protein
MIQQKELERLHPDEPWLWRPSWAARRIEDSSRQDMVGAWVFAVLWNAVSVPALVLGLPAAVAQRKPAALLVLLFPAAGGWLLLRAILLTLRRRRYGISRFELDTLPAAIGGSLSGTVRTTIDVLPTEGFQVRLSCVRRITSRSGKSSSTSERILWEEEQRVRGEQVRDYSGMGIRIPVSFRLPPDVEPWDTSNRNNQVLWRLNVNARVPGIDYDSTFQVPVFRTADPVSSGAELGSGSGAVPEPYHQPVRSSIRVTSNQRGTEVLFPAARNIGAALGLTSFTAIWWATVGLQLYLRAPVVFPIVTALFGLLLTIGVLELWLRVSRVMVAAGTLTVASGYLVPGRERRIAAADVADVVAAIGMQAGNVPYYDVEIRRKDGKKLVAGRSVREKREAEWLAGTIKRALTA